MARLSQPYGCYPVETSLLKDLVVYLNRAQDLASELLAEKAARDKGHNAVCLICKHRLEMVTDEPCKSCFDEQTETFVYFEKRSRASDEKE